MTKFNRENFAQSLTDLLADGAITDTERRLLTQVQQEVQAGHNDDRVLFALRQRLAPLALKNALSKPAAAWYATTVSIQIGASRSGAGWAQL